MGSIGLKIKSVRGTVAVLFVVSAVSMGLLVLLRSLTGRGIDYFTVEPVTQTKSLFYMGLYSNIGVLLLAAAAAVCLFARAVLPASEETREASLFALWAGLISAVFALDDMFLLHEEVFPIYLSISEAAVSIFYALAVGLFLFRFRKTVLRSDYPLLALALAFIALSVGFDNLYRLIHHQLYAHYLLEDGSKMIGIYAWFAYFTGFCVKEVRRGPGASV